MRRALFLTAITLSAPLTALAAEGAEKKGYWEYRLTDPATNLAMLALVVFFAIVWYVGGFKMIAKALDARAEGIKNELEAARRLREEAQKTLSDAERRQKEAEAEAAEIIEAAKKEAARLTEQSKKDLKERVARRTALAEERISRAEEEATDNVRRAAADAATEAARRILSDEAGSGKLDTFDTALKNVEKALS